MNVLYLSYDGLTDGLGRSQVLPYIVGLCQKGHSFTVISFEKPGRTDAEFDHVERILQKHNIRWVRLAYTKSPPLLSTIYDVLKLRYTVFALHRKHGFDIVHCRSYITSLVGMALKRKAGVRFIFDMRAFYADERIDGGLWNLKNPVYRSVYRFFKRKEKAFLQWADHTVVLTEKAQEIIHSWQFLPHQPIPMTVIPCCADLEHFQPSQINNELRKELMQRLELRPDELVLAYLGSIGTWYMLDEMMDFFKALLRSRPEARFLFITADDPGPIVSCAKERGIGPARLAIAPATREQVPTFLSLAHAAIFFIKPVFSKSGSSPTKHGEMLGMGLPVIANSRVGDVDRIISSTGSGLIVHSFNKEAYEQAIEQLDKMLQLPGTVMRQAAETHYALTTGVERYDRIYHQVMTLSDDTSRCAE